MGTKDKAIDNLYQPELLEELDGTPESSLTTPWCLGDHGFFRVHAAIIRPKPEQAQHDVSLSQGKTKDILKAIPDIIEFLEKKPRRYDP